MASMKTMIWEQIDKHKTASRALLERAEAEKRDLTVEEAREFDDVQSNLEACFAQLRKLDKFGADADAAAEVLSRMEHGNRSSGRGGEFVYEATGERAALREGESFRSHPMVAGHREPNEDHAVAQYGNLGNMIRALSTTGGVAVVPTVWSGELIDLARNKSAVMQAGASIVPMDAGTVKIGRLTGDPTAAFRTEASTITPSDPTFDNVTLTATTMSTLVIGSLEWFQDANNADQIVKDAISKAMAQRLDLAALYGGITTGAGSINLATPPNPRGVLAALNAVLPGNVLGAAANGTAQTAATYFAEVLDTIYKVRYGNEEPNALIWNAKLSRQYAGANDTTGQPLRLPADVEGLPRYMTNEVPSYTQGTMTNRATDLFAADWTQLLIGQRLPVSIQVLTEKYADSGQVGIVAHWRGDVQPARPAAFAVYRSIQGAL
ncbi:HK97 family phage major capsid protein [Arthrobacter sp. SLBN-112]|uniref:phage major capsid protein n=1 Tax=Arthrobacter sp. SLBN-112 TaxID=2768452 RepID=UPI00116C40DD|nr:phage major capsid protein [Arthrobacter sp. SLBN-112]TQJ41513.1 HK97 family phage major capsid protein [Arthrobacter sp. SLBN-112]